MEYGYTLMKDLQGYFTENQLNKIYTSIDGKEDPEFKLLILLLMRTGRRITEIIGRDSYTHSYRVRKKTIKINNQEIPNPEYEKIKHKDYPEIKGLTPSDIDFENQHIVFTILKKKQPTTKIKVIDSQTMNTLKSYIYKFNIQPDQPLINLTRFQAYYRLKKLCKGLEIFKVGAKPPHPHNFRHTFAINFIKKAKTPQSLKLLQQYLDHSNLGITSHYLQFSQEDQREIIEEIFKKEEKD